MIAMPSEQTWFSGPNTKHPLSDPATAKVLISRQTVGDSATVLGKITAWTDELMSLPDVPLPDRFAVLDLLDSHAKNHQINLVPEYLETARLRKLTEGALWTTSFNFWKTMGDAYLVCLNGFQATPTPNASTDFLLPILVGRIIRSLTLQFKWTLLRHQKVDEKLWLDLGKTYRFAEEHGFATRRVTVYTSRHGESSAQTELLKILMLAVSAPDALSPAHQHIAERIIAHFGDRFVLTETPRTNSTFSFDLGAGVAPSRSSKEAAALTSVRYFGPGHAQEGLEELSGFMHRTGTLPPYVNVGQSFDRSQMTDVLGHLARNWADTPILRHGERLQQAAEFIVVPGLSDNARWLGQLLQATQETHVAMPESAERWMSSDASENGCAAIIPSAPSDWVAIGALMGIHRENDASRMAVIRRIICEENGQHRTGMAFLGDTAVPVALFPAGASHATDPDRPGEAAILISRHANAHGHVEILTRPDGIGKAPNLQMRLRGTLRALSQTQIIEETRHYRRASYQLG